MDEPVTELTRDQARFAIRRMALWCATRHATGYGERYPVNPAEIDHSALLYRVLRGRDPLPDPPKLEHSYPAYPDWREYA